MASSINASTSGAGGLITTADNTGILQLQSGGTTIATIDSTGLTMASGKKVFSEGSVLQVVSVTSTTRDTSASTTYVDTSLSASITPSSSSNKIFVIVTYTLGNDNSSYATWSQLVRGSTQIAQRTYYAGGVGSAYAAVSANISVLDSPSTTSSTTYKMQIRSDNGAGTVAFNGPSTMSYAGGTPTNYATITLMEIKG